MRCDHCVGCCTAQDSVTITYRKHELLGAADTKYQLGTQYTQLLLSLLQFLQALLRSLAKEQTNSAVITPFRKENKNNSSSSSKHTDSVFASAASADQPQQSTQLFFGRTPKQLIITISPSSVLPPPPPSSLQKPRCSASSAPSPKPPSTA